MDDGRPDFSGTYDVTSLTPFTRDPDLGEKGEFTQEEVDELRAGGAYRTSVIVEPPDGQLPALSEAGVARRATLRPYYKGKYPGEAWWLADGGDSYDNPEGMSVGDRCLYMSLTVPVRPSA